MARRGRRGHRRSGPKGLMGKIGNLFRSAGRKPVTRVLVPSLVVTGLLQLLTIPLPNGDGFFGRLQAAFNSGGKNLFASDNAQTGSGNNMFSILALQLQQNLPTAAPTFIGAALAGLVGRIAKL